MTRARCDGSDRLSRDRQVFYQSRSAPLEFLWCRLGSRMARPAGGGSFSGAGRWIFLVPTALLGASLVGTYGAGQALNRFISEVPR